MEKIALQYMVAPFIETALADAYKAGAKDWDQAGGFFPDWSATQANFVNGAVASYAGPMAAALTIAGHAAAYDVLFERDRQKEQERFDPAHDDAHDRNQLAIAAACYISPCELKANGVPVEFPWGGEWWKPGGDDLASYRRRLVKGAALAIAEIERIDRLAARAHGNV